MAMDDLQKGGWTWSALPHSSMNPSFLNLPTTTFTRERVVPTRS